MISLQCLKTAPDTPVNTRFTSDTLANTTQEAVGYLFCNQRTLLAHIQLMIHSNPQVPLCSPAAKPVVPQSGCMHATLLSQVHMCLLHLVYRLQSIAPAYLVMLDPSPALHCRQLESLLMPI